jgi:anti-anti-sigma factor
VFAVRDHGPARMLTVSGEIDRATEGAVRAELRTAIEHHAVVVLDLSGVEFFGAAGVAALVQAREWAEEHPVPTAVGLRLLVRPAQPGSDGTDRVIRDCQRGIPGPVGQAQLARHLPGIPTRSQIVGPFGDSDVWV